MVVELERGLGVEDAAGEDRAPDHPLEMTQHDDARSPSILLFHEHGTTRLAVAEDDRCTVVPRPEEQAQLAQVDRGVGVGEDDRIGTVVQRVEGAQHERATLPAVVGRRKASERAVGGGERIAEREHGHVVAERVVIGHLGGDAGAAVGAAVVDRDQLPGGVASGQHPVDLVELDPQRVLAGWVLVASGAESVVFAPHREDDGDIAADSAAGHGRLGPSQHGGHPGIERRLGVRGERAELLVGRRVVSGSGQQIVGDPPDPTVVLGAGELQRGGQVGRPLEEVAVTLIDHRAASAAS